MKIRRSAIAVVALASSLSLVGSAAFGATGSVDDLTGDAVLLEQLSPDPLDVAISLGDFDIDLTRIDIDHGTQRLDIVSRFSSTTSGSWTQISAEIDTDGDSVTDYTAMVSKDGAASAVVDRDARKVCGPLTTSERVGLDGAITLQIPRSCLGTPQQVAVHVNVFWVGLDTSYPQRYIVDSAPGEFFDSVTTFSAPVASSDTGTATSLKPPAPAPAATSVSLNLSKKIHQSGSTPVKLTVVPQAPAAAKGELRIRLNGRLQKRVNATGGKKVTHTFKRAMKKGTYMVQVTFVPIDPVRFKKSSKTVSFTVKR